VSQARSQAAYSPKLVERKFSKAGYRILDSFVPIKEKRSFKIRPITILWEYA
jgi:hypothetical protein